MDINQLQQVEPCPKCKGMDGWYEKRVCKYMQIFEADGTVFDASSMVRVRGGDRRYCLSCSRDITDQIRPVFMFTTSPVLKESTP